MRVGIIGAGVTGLSAAYELSKSGHLVTVYERAPFLGGQASTFDVNGVRLERGYHHLFTGDTDILDLMDEIGLGHQIRFFESKVGTLYDGKIYNFVTPMDLLRFTPLNFIDRIRLGLATIQIRLMKNWQKIENVTAENWLREKVGTNCYETFWEPMLRGKFGEYYKHIGMAWIWGKFNTRFSSRGKSMSKEMLGYPIGSFGEIFDTLSDTIVARGGAIHLNTVVDRISSENGHIAGLEILAPNGNQSVNKFDAVIATPHSHMFLNLAPSLPADYRANLASTNYLAAVLLILVLDRPLSQIYWLNIADRSIPFVGVIEQTNLVSKEHYGGKHIIYLSNYLDRDHPVYKFDHEEILEHYLPHLRKINPDFNPSWIQQSYHQRVNAAQPVIGTNYSQRIPKHRTPINGLYLANTTQIYPEDRGTNYSIRLGKKVARLVINDYSER